MNSAMSIIRFFALYVALAFAGAPWWSMFILGFCDFYAITTKYLERRRARKLLEDGVKKWLQELAKAKTQSGVQDVAVASNTTKEMLN